MREFIYVSERKLTQFVPDRPSFWRRMRLQKVSGSVGVAQTKLGLETAPATSARYESLDQVVAHLDAEARWFTDPAAVAGAWVYFEARVYQTAIWLEPFDAAAALFLDVDPDDGPLPQRRLFLHGSAEHLVGQPLPAREECSSPPSHVAAPMSAPLSPGVWEAVGFGLGHRRNPFPTVPGRTYIRDASIVRDTLRWAYTDLAPNEFCRSQAAWSAGCARVTSVVEVDGVEVVTASPLVVERVAPPA